MVFLDYLINVIQSLCIGSLCIIYSDKKSIMHAFFLSLLLFIQITFYNYFSSYEGFLSMTYSFTIFGYLSLFGKRRLLENIFLSLFVNLLISIGNDTCLLLFHITGNLSIFEIVANDYSRNMVGFGSTIILSIIMWLLITVRKKFDDIFTNYTKIILIISLLSNYIVIILEKMIYSPEFTELETELLLSVLFVLLISSFSVYILFSDKLSSINKQKESMLAQQLSSFKDYYAVFKKQSKNLSIIKHDLKNIFIVLAALLKNHEYDKALSLIEDTDFEVSKTDSAPITEILEIDYILATKYTKASKHNVRIISSIDKTPLCHFNEIDIALTLANLLDNAIENSDPKNPIINLSISEINTQLRIIIENKVSKNVLETNPLLLTTKENPDIHGYGIESVKLIIEKLNGHISFTQEGDTFSALIILPIN